SIRPAATVESTAILSRASFQMESHPAPLYKGRAEVSSHCQDTEHVAYSCGTPSAADRSRLHRGSPRYLANRHPCADRTVARALLTQTPDRVFEPETSRMRRRASASARLPRQGTRRPRTVEECR